MNQAKAIGIVSRALETNEKLTKFQLKQGNFDTAEAKARKNELIALKAFLSLVHKEEFSEIAGRKPETAKPPNSLFF